MAAFLAAFCVFAAFHARVMIVATASVAGGGCLGAAFVFMATTRFAAGRK
jgi:hypothetical protein